MSTCQGSIPVTTKVDEPMREFVDESAEDLDISRTELVRRVLELYLKSQNDELQCPSCAGTVRIHPEEMDLTTGEINAPPPTTVDTTDTGEVADQEPESDTLDEEVVAGETTDTDVSGGKQRVQHRLAQLESAVEAQRDEIGHLRSRLSEQEVELADASESAVPHRRVERLQEQVEWHGDHIKHMIPRIEALTEVSDLSDSGVCPKCGDELSVEQSFADLEDPSLIKCSGCEQVVGKRA